MPRLTIGEPPTDLRYKQVEQLLAGLFDIHEDRIDLLSGRLRLFRQKEFPPYVGERGKPFRYDMDAVLKLAVGFALLDAFVPQDAVPAFVRRHWDQIGRGYEQAFAALAEMSEDQAIVSPLRPVLLLTPMGLRTFRTGPADSASDDDGDGRLGARLVDAEEIVAYDDAAARQGFGAARTVVELQHLAMWTRRLVLDAGWLPRHVLDDYRPGRA